MSPHGLTVRTLHPGEREALLDLLEASFGERELFVRYLDHDPHLGPEDTWVAVDGARLVSCVQIFERRIRSREGALRLGGIGSVCTHPDFAGRGVASGLLERAIEEMEHRGHALSLLFSTHFGLYGRLGWKPRPCPHLVLRCASRPGGSAEGARPFDSADLPAVRALYERYNAPRPLTTIRDDAYWTGQLHFAGNPEEQFDLAAPSGAPVAFLRCAHFDGMQRVIEFAHAGDRASAARLAELLRARIPEASPLIVPDVGDRQLEAGLRACDCSFERIDLPGSLWRPIDPEALRRSLGPGEDTRSAEEALDRITGAPGGVFWPSDRF